MVLKLSLLVLLLALLSPAAPALAAYPVFEGHQTHPLEITAASCTPRKLLALNTPDTRLSVFDLDEAGIPTLVAEVPVGVEPVSVRARSCSEAWVVNHVSDSISVVDLTAGNERVVRSIVTDDEPADVVFAGGGGDPRAFVSISQRNRVDVYDAANPGAPLFQVAIDGEDPRALARNAAGTEVYAAVFHSGNQTLILSGESSVLITPDNRIEDAAGPYGGGPFPPPPGYDADYGSSFPFSARPTTSAIVRWRDCTGGPAPEWCDDNDNSWNDLLETAPATPIQMRDHDVAVIDADAADPSTPGPGYVDTLGTLNFGIATHPGNGKLYVSNTDARNHVRFEQALEDLGDGDGNEDGVCDDTENCHAALDGRLVDTRLAIAQAGGSVDAQLDLNAAIDFTAPISSVDASLALGQPNGMAFNSAGDRLYVAALLSRKVAVIDTGSEPGTVLARIGVGEGPTGVALLESASRLYVLNRIDNTISRVDTGTQTEILPRLDLFNPEPPHVKQGRHFLYDGQDTSGRGDVACASCHAFGNFDLLAWDLGDPTVAAAMARPAQTPTPEVGEPIECGATPNQPGCGAFAPLKGPRTTQSLRGMLGVGRLHWHGDRPDFDAFNVAFVGLLRSAAMLSGPDMAKFTAFALELAYPPNPNRSLDDTLAGAQAQNGETDYLTGMRDSPFDCVDCHALPTGTNGRFINSVPDLQHQAMKVPQLRNLYEKTGFDVHPDAGEPVPASTRNGFGFTHDGGVDSLSTFLNLPVFSFPNQAQVDEMIAFLMQFPTGQSAAVGHQLTFDGTNNGDAALLARLGVLLESLSQGEIQLVVTGRFGGVLRSWNCTALSPVAADCQPDRSSEPAIDALVLENLAAAGSELTFEAVPVGFGLRMGNDRDMDGHFNQNEIDAGSDPADPTSTPSSVGPLPAALLGRHGLVLLAALLALGMTRRLRRG